MGKINGEDVEVHYGDKVVPLEDRLAFLDHEVKWLRRMLYGVLGVLALHAIAPNLDILNLILGYFFP